WLWDDTIFWLSVFNTLLYTVVASIIKFAIGLYLALLLNERLPFKALIRAVVLIPFIVPTVLSAIAFWWIYDSQFSIISWSLRKLGLIQQNIDFLGDPNNATHLMATLSYQRAILGSQLGEGAAISTSMIPFLLVAILISWFGLQRRKWQQGEDG